MQLQITLFPQILPETYLQAENVVEVVPVHILHDWQYRLHIPFCTGFYVDVFFDVLNMAKMLAFDFQVFFVFLLKSRHIRGTQVGFSFPRRILIL